MSSYFVNCNIVGILLLWFAKINLIFCFQRFNSDGMRIDKVSCNHTGMEVHIISRNIFRGIIYTQGNSFNPRCRYSAPEMGTKDVFYFMPLTDCGNLLKEVDDYIFISNAIIVQKHRIIETDSDIVQSLSCKLPISQSKDMQLFSHERHPTIVKEQGLESWMDFYSGSDILGIDLPNKLSVGDEFSIVVQLKDGKMYKDLEVEKCWAHDNETISTSDKVVQIFNLYACQYSDWISGFTLSKGMENISDVTVFGLLKAFKFSSTNNLHITCSIQICDNFCIKYCDIPETVKSNDYKLRIKRSNPEINSSIGLKRRHRLMKATIKALGAKLIERNKGGSSTNDTNFYRSDEIKNKKNTNKFSGNFPNQVIVNHRQGEILSEPDRIPEEHGLHYDTNGQVLDITANNVYTFNLTNNLVVFTDHEFNFRYEYRNSPRSTFDCVAKGRFLIATISLSFITLSLIIACISLVLHIRKEKRKSKKADHNNFFLYDLY